MIEYISIISISFLLACFVVIILNLFFSKSYEKIDLKAIFIGNNIGYLILKISQGIIKNVL
jgi:hypothetical protein